MPCARSHACHVRRAVTGGCCCWLQAATRLQK
jgi:hypothetical protein